MIDTKEYVALQQECERLRAENQRLNKSLARYRAQYGELPETDKGEEMKKLFISQPMKGKTNEEIEAERAKAVEEAKAVLNDDVEVIDSFFKDAPVDARPLWFLGKSIELLSVADAAYFAKDWDKYRGCKIEHSCAVEYGIKVIEYVEG